MFSLLTGLSPVLASQQATKLAKEHQKEEEEKAKATGKPVSSNPGFDKAPVGEIPASA